MLNMRDEQATNTMDPEEPIPDGVMTSPPGYQVQDEVGIPPWEDFQSEQSRPQHTTIRAAVFGGLAGAVFFFGLAVAIVSGHFLPVFLVALALTSLLGPLGSAKPQAIYGGVQGCVFLLGLAVLAATSWWWPGILVLMGIAAILGIGNGLLALRPVARPGMTIDQYYKALSNQDYVQAYQYLDASINREQFTSMARQYDAEQGTVSRYSIAPDLAVTTTPLPGEPLPLVTLARDPAENLTVTVWRTHTPSYMAHLLVRRAGKTWKITAFDRI